MAPLIDPWPGTPGGAYSPHWGERIRLYVWLAIHGGTPMRWGSVAGNADVLTAGNVWGSGVPAPPGPTPPTNRLWVDLTCDVTDLETHIGGVRSDGALTRADAATARITLVDPSRQYDPINPDSPWQFQGRSRLMPGTPVLVFAETYTPGATPAITQHSLFTGTVDSWAEPWDPHPTRRRATVVASDDIKVLTGLDRGAQPLAGAGDTVAQRLERILTYYGWQGTRRLDPSTITEAATDMGSSAWDLLGKATDDEIGFTYIDTDGVLQFHARATWSTTTAPVLVVGCSPTVTGEADIVTDATVTTTDQSLKNAIYAGRQGGAVASARSQDSILQFGERGLRKTDLGVADDATAAGWADYVLTLLGWPRARVSAVTLRPAIDPTVWPALLDLDLVVDRLRVVWTPPDATTTYDVTGRAIGVDHSVTHRRWEVDLNLIHADVYARVFRWGPAETDRLDVGNVYAA